MDTSSSPSKRSSIPIPKRKTSLHLYISGGGSSSNSSSNVGSGSASMNEDESTSFTRSMLGSFGHSESPLPPVVGGTHPPEYVQLKESYNRLTDKCEKLMKRNEQLERTNEQLGQTVKQLSANAESSSRELAEFTEKNRRLRRKLSEIIPSTTPGDPSSVVDGAESDDDEITPERTALAGGGGPAARKGESAGDAKTTEGDWLNEIEKLKSYQNNVDLQLYEANEKISELLENKQQYEETIEKLRAENTELNKVARLMSRNMLESIDTTKSLGNSLMQVRRERDLVRGMVRQSCDSVDSKTSTNEEIQKIRSEYELQRKTYEAQFIEYKSLMSEEHERKTNDQIVLLELEVERLRELLVDVLGRAERAEEEVRTLRQQITARRFQERSGLAIVGSNLYAADSSEALDDLSLLCRRCSLSNDRRSPTGSSLSSAVAPEAPTLPPPPPPPPPPLPLLLAPAANNLANSKHLISPRGSAAGIAAGTEPALGLSEAISRQKLNHVAITNVNSPQPATGLDSVIADIKSGKVTLRRRRPNVPAVPDTDDAAGSADASGGDGQPNYSQLAARNPALKEMYEILERMKRQNRKSKIIVESEFGCHRHQQQRGGGDSAAADDEDNAGGGLRGERIITDVVDL
ncbi:shootin-1 [Anopheles cruzii]|uniref:shootin-1 n=1 Tax=Anopheles cruzii TaxID=68878 RepID=UPI0022EC3262|nr:shootin-1 [Anopheles cruzii]